MTDSVAQIGLDLVVNSGGFEKQMNRLTKTAVKLAGVMAAAFSVKSITNFGRECVAAAEVQSGAELKLATIMRQRMGATERAIQSVKDYAAEQQNLGVVGDEVQMSGAQQLATFLNTSDALKTLIPAMNNLAVQQNGVNVSAESMVNIGNLMGKVMQGQTSALTRVGISFDTAQEKILKYGNEQQRAATLAKVITDNVGEMNRAFANTPTGQMQQIKNNFGDAMETIGFGVQNFMLPFLKIVNTLVARMATLANSFKAFSELVTGNKAEKSVSNVGTTLDNASESANNLQENTEGVGNAAKKAAKQMKSLMGFDNINKLSEPTETSEDTSSGSIGGDTSSKIDPVDYGGLAQGETAVDKLGKKFAEVFGDIQKLCEPTLKALKRLREEGLAKLGDFTWTALKDFFEHFLKPVGAWVMGEGLPRFIDALNDGLMKVDFDRINDALKKLWDALTPFTIKIGEGLLWFWENVLVPLGTWTANEVVPRFLETLANVIKIITAVLDALEPLWQWFWDNVLKPIAEWTGGIFLDVWDKINDALGKFADWCSKNPGAIQTAAKVIGTFFAAWKITEMLAFIQQSGGIIAAIGLIKDAIFGATAAKLADKAETIALTAMYAKDFVVSVAQSVAALAKQAAQLVINKAAKLADAVAQGVMTAATLAWNVAATVATAVTTALGAAIAFLTSPIGIAIVAITALIAAGVLIYKNWDTVKKYAEKIWTAIKDFLGKTIESIKKFFAGLWSGIKETFANVGSWFKEKFKQAFTNVKNAWSSAKNFFKDIWNGIKGAFANTALWYKEKFTQAFTNVKNAFSGAKSYFTNIRNAIQSVFSGIPNWFTTTFRNAWEGVKRVFSSGGQIFNGIKDGILNSLRSVINSLIRGINNVVAIPFNGLNNALWNLRNTSIMGMYPFGWLPSINVPQIPMLAEGGYVKANTPQLAMIGDNKHQGEIVAPEDKLEAMAIQAAKAASGTGGVSRDELESILNRCVMRIVAALSQLGFKVDGKELARAQRMAQTALNMQYNDFVIQ